MNATRLRAPLGMGLFLLAALGGRGQIALALSPESPKVREAVEKAVKFLETPAADDGRVGAKALVGLVLLKNHAEAKHPRVVEAVEAIRNAVKGREPAKIAMDIYGAGVSIIFLVTLDPVAYSPEIECLLDFLKSRQKSHGGWGYPEKPTGDTSMTQYGVLCAWEAKQAGFNVSQDSIEQVSTWLLKTQDPGGGFGYQGEPSATKGLTKQKEVRHSMTAAGLGSLFICSDLLGFVPRVEKRDESLPAALKEVREKVAPPVAAANANANTKIDSHRVKEAEILGNKWMAKHYDMHRAEWWTYYYLYAYERYASFRELAEGKAEKEPKWYNDGARFLLNRQGVDGSWSPEKEKSVAGKAPDTAFAALFLLRSSKRSIEKAYGYDECTMAAGRGLPRETGKLTVFRGRVLPAAQWTSAEELLPVLQKGDDDAEFEKAIAALAQLPRKEAEVLAAKHPEVLRGLIANRSPQARIAAVQAIGNGNNLDLVPALIRALGDPDKGVGGEACNALRRLTRTRGIGTLAGPLSEGRRREEIQHWKAWYLAIRPEAEFEN